MQNKRDYDYDVRYRRPRGWRDLKQSLGGTLAPLVFRRLERLADQPGVGGVPRELLLVAVYHFTTLTAAERTRADYAYGHWVDMLEGKGAGGHKTPPREAPAAEKLPPGETVDGPAGHKLCEDFGAYTYWMAPQAEKHPLFGPFYFRCSTCGRKYLVPGALHRHLLKAHGVDIGKPPIPWPIAPPEPAATVDVLGVAYAVRRAPGHVHGRDGRLCGILIDHSRREFVVAASIPDAELPARLAEAAKVARRSAAETPARREDDDDTEGEEWKGVAA